MRLARSLGVSLVSYLATTSIGGHAQTSPPDAQAPPSPFLFSIDLLLDEGADPVKLGIRNGQTVAQAAEIFCLEHGFDEALKIVLMPQLVKVLEDGMTEAIGRNVPVGYETSDTLEKEHESSTNESNATTDGTADVPFLTLEISLDGKETRTLPYYAGQEPVDVATAFCSEHLDPSSPLEAYGRCSASLSASITERAGLSDAPSGYKAEPEKPEAQSGAQQMQADNDMSVEPWLVMPLNINGVEMAMQIHRGSKPEDLARELCHRQELGFNEAALGSCISQIEELVIREINAHTPQGGEEGRRQKKKEPFTFQVPVNLAGLEVYAEFRTSETPRESALKFCGANILAIESALGLDSQTNEVDIDAIAEDGEMAGKRQASGGRESLQAACAMVVEDAINAVLLGLRERVLEAEKAQAERTQENAAKSRLETDTWPRYEENVTAPGEAPDHQALLSLQSLSDTLE